MTEIRTEQIEDTLDSGKLLDNESWNTPSLQNSWEDYGGSFDPCRYMKDDNGFVHIKGLIKSGSTGSNVLAFTLPTGYRPADVLVTPAMHYGSGNVSVFTQVRITAGGQVRIYTSSSTWFSFGFISFKAE